MSQISTAVPTPAAPGPTQSNGFFWYNVGAFAPMGLAVPNWGANPTTLNSPIFNLVKKIGHNVQNLMLSPDAWLATPPSMNTVSAMVRLINRFRQIINGRTVVEGTGRLQLQPGNATPAPFTFVVFPTPYFTVVNSWLIEYAELMLLMMTDAMQSGENARPLEITQPFSQLVGQYVARLNKFVASELLQIPIPAPAQVTNPGTPQTNDPGDPDFVITPAMVAAYAPSTWFTPTELTAVATPPNSIPTKATLQAVTGGLAVSTIPTLPFWPGTTAPTPSSSTAAPATSQGSSAGTIPTPQI